VSIWNYITIGTGIFLVFLILIQTRGASLGAGLGGGAEVNTTRRGTDKTIFQITIIMVMVFAASLILGIVIE
jgi:preprotein translocase subunit SecG